MLLLVTASVQADQGVAIEPMATLIDNPDDLVITCRSNKVKKAFDKLMGFPRGRKGYIVDHICPLAIGGLDIVENLQYQTILEGKAKDRIELLPSYKGVFCTEKNSLPYRTVFNCK